MSLALKLNAVGKAFGNFWALRNVTLEFRTGEVHALLGENGAGKSTLIKLIAGVHAPTEGSLSRGTGEALHLLSPRDALEAGIGVVHQELDLFDNLTVAENIALGIDDSGFLRPSRDRMTERATKALKELEEDNISPHAKVGTLSTSDKQLVAVAKVLTWDAKIIVFDEPTSALNAVEATKLLGKIRHLRDSGVAVIYVSHKLAEIFAIADRVSVIRDGNLVTSGAAHQHNHETIVEAMLGRSPSEIFPKRVQKTAGVALLEVKGATGRNLQGVSLRAGKGEIIALAGLPDSGPSALLQHVFGLQRRTAGSITISGRDISAPTPRSAIRNGIAYLPADRLRDGLLPLMSVLRNAEAASEAMHADSAAVRRDKALHNIKLLSVRTASLFNRITSLSGGNQQKTLLARWLVMQPSVLMLDDPTRGVDIGAKAEIYRILRQIADTGAAVLFTSSDSLELASLSDRIILFKAGKVAAEYSKPVTHAELDLAIAAP